MTPRIYVDGYGMILITIDGATFSEAIFETHFSVSSSNKLI